MEPGAVAVTACRTVAFAWEHEPGVSKLQSPVVEAEKKPSVGGRTPASSRTKKAEAHAPHRLRVPPPPGGPASPQARSRPSRRAVRPEEDPFLAAYIACTASGRKAGRGQLEAQKLLGWAGLRLRLGLGLGLGLSCKSSCGVAEESVVSLGAIPEVDDR